MVLEDRLGQGAKIVTALAPAGHQPTVSRDMHTRMHVLNALLLATLFGASLLAWPDLPARIPGHFSAGGEVTRWEVPSLGRWLLVPLLALGVTAMNYILAALLPRWPGMFNHPDKAAFLALPLARRAPVIARMRALMYGMSLLITALFAVLQWVRYRTAAGAEPDAYIALTLVMGAMIGPIGLGVWLPPVSREVREQARREREGAGAAR